MSIKYKVVAVAYRNLETKVAERVAKYSIKDINTLDDLNQTSSYCTRGFNLNDRVCIYLDWFKSSVMEKIQEDYTVSILEMPIKSSDSRVELLELLDIEYEEDLLILDKVDV